MSLYDDRRSNRSALSCALMLCAALLTSCNDDEGPEEIFGRFELTEFDGHAPPAVLTETASDTVIVIAANIVFDVSRTFAYFQERYIALGATHYTEYPIVNGTYAKDGADMILLPFEGGAIRIRYEEGDILMDGGRDRVMRFEKEE